MRQLKIRHLQKKASSKKGQATVTAILNAARSLVIEEGYAGLSMRAIATRSGIKIGNLTYYYASKTELLADLVDAVIQSYVGWWDEVMADDTLSPEQQFVTILTFILEDLGAPETTGFFPELWALANHEKNASEAMGYLYQLEHDMLVEMIGRLNPSLGLEDRKILAVHILASIEGHTVFIGYRKKWTQYAKPVSNILIHSYLSLIRSLTHEEIHTLQNSV
ncbi:MAG: TetR/AcrR family transcriptional regulator [Kordiimonas sp.]